MTFDKWMSPSKCAAQLDFYNHSYTEQAPFTLLANMRRKFSTYSCYHYYWLLSLCYHKTSPLTVHIVTRSVLSLFLVTSNALSYKHPLACINFRFLICVSFELLVKAVD